MYTVLSQAGDCLCSIARREGFSNCGTLRTTPGNAALLDIALPVNSVVTIPQWRDTHFYAKVAAGRRYTIRYVSPIEPRQPTRVAFVKTIDSPPADDDAINSIGISRYITRSTDGMGDDNWVDDLFRTYDEAACKDANVFNVDVHDPNAAGVDVVAFVEAMMPIYGNDGMRTASTRFQAGPERQARSLSVTCSSVNGGARHRSCYLRLVVDEFDRAVRPRQTLLVSDMVDGGHPEVEILDQDIHVRYECQDCPRPHGERCVLSEQTLQLRRGRSVDLSLRILRATRAGLAGVRSNDPDDGIVKRQSAHDRVLKNVRRIWAQEEITFAVKQIETVDIPSDMLSIADPNGSVSKGGGQIGFAMTLYAPGIDGVKHTVGPLSIQAGWTPAQTASSIKAEVDQMGIEGLVCTASENPAIGGQVAGCVDVLFRLGQGHVELADLTSEKDQDAAQGVTLVRVDIGDFRIRSTAENAYIGDPMQRCLYKAFVNNPTGVNIFVVSAIKQGGILAHALNSQQHLPPAFRPIKEVENCIVISYEGMAPNLGDKPATLAHEIGHLLIDNAEHSVDDFAEGSLMNASTSLTFGGFDGTKRIIDWEVDWQVVVVGDEGLKLEAQKLSMHAQVEANVRIHFTSR